MITYGGSACLGINAGSQQIKKWSPSKSDPLISDVIGVLPFCGNISVLI
jgi:hypothetical protein